MQTYFECLRCGKPLTNPVSQIRGYGKVCFGKLMKENAPIILEDYGVSKEKIPNEQIEVLCNIPPMKLKGDFKTKEVRLNDHPLDLELSFAIKQHSPDGFNWGYGGSGPAQLALAIIAYYTKNLELILRLYQIFKWEVIAGLPQGDFKKTIDIGRWFKKHLGER